MFMDLNKGDAGFGVPGNASMTMARVQVHSGEKKPWRGQGSG